MSFDRSTRNALAATVGKARERLKTDVIDQLRGLSASKEELRHVDLPVPTYRYAWRPQSPSFAMRPQSQVHPAHSNRKHLGFQADGAVLDLDAIAGLSEEERAAAHELRALLEHFVAAESGAEGTRRQAAFDRLAREIGFTSLNRLVALRMAEERGLIVQSIGGGLGSSGFLIFERIANGALGSRVATYRAYLECLYDEIARDLPALFDRTDPQSRIFPGERCLDDVLRLLNDPTLAHLWKEDETIGWVYQYYNDPQERKKMRESQAPRTSRELAVRNQFFTPRYVVEFLTDNTLGRLWYEMRRGETRLAEECCYLVRRKHTVFLRKGEEPPQPYETSQGWCDPDELGEIWTRGIRRRQEAQREDAYDVEHAPRGRPAQRLVTAEQWRPSQPNEMTWPQAVSTTGPRWSSPRRARRGRHRSAVLPLYWCCIVGHTAGPDQRREEERMTETGAQRSNAQLADLGFLVGDWEMEVSNAAFLPQPAGIIRGQVSFAWIENGAFLLLRMGENALWLMSRDEAQSLYTVLYFDARAVSRVYTMSFTDKTWTMWRDSEQFSQRFTGHVSEDGRTITAEWRKKSEQREWEHDFDVTYRRL